jgi:hypothetical protein
VQDARVKRAENYALYMRNWLAILTATVTLAFLIAAMLGYKSSSDIENAKRQINQTATDVSRQAAEVGTVVAKSKDLVAGLEPRVQKLNVRVNEFDAKYNSLNHAAEGLKKDLRRTSAVAQKASLDTSNLQTNIGGLVGDAPIILKVPGLSVGTGVSSIEGQNFGEAKGKLFASVQGVAIPLQAAVEIEKESIWSWSDKAITFVLSARDQSALLQSWRDRQEQERKLNLSGSLTGNASYLTFQVVTAGGNTSGWSSAVFWFAAPAAPTGLKVDAQ